MGHLPKQRLDQRTLATAVGANQGVHVAGLDLEADLVEDGRAAKGQADVGELDGGSGQWRGEGLLDGHAPASWIARTTVSRLPVISFSYFSALYSP
ncbi:hypothetical protein D3C81_2129850 [compost metagenome]